MTEHLSADEALARLREIAPTIGSIEDVRDAMSDVVELRAKDAGDDAWYSMGSSAVDAWNAAVSSIEDDEVEPDSYLAYALEGIAWGAWNAAINAAARTLGVDAEGLNAAVMDRHTHWPLADETLPPLPPWGELPEYFKNYGIELRSQDSEVPS